MEILRFEPQMAAGVAACYNDLVAGVARCAPVTAEAFATLERVACPLCREEELLVAREAPAEIAGFVHVGISAPPGAAERSDQGEPGVIRFLAYRPGQRATGQVLLHAAEAWIRQRGRPKILAWTNDYTYAFYHSPFAHLSDQIAHVRALLAYAGYDPFESELLFDWLDFEPPAVPRPGLDFEPRLEWGESLRIGAKLLKPKLVVRAMRGEQTIGHCEMAGWTSAPNQPSEPRWTFCSDLMVSEPVQGRGLGKFLLATGLAEMRQAACRHAGISTDWDNHRAALFYANFGYRFCDRTFMFRKEVGGEHRASPS